MTQTVFGQENVVAVVAGWQDGPWLEGEKSANPDFLAKFKDVEGRFDEAVCERGEDCVFVTPSKIGGFLADDWNGDEKSFWNHYYLFTDEHGKVVAVCEDCAHDVGLVKE